MRSSIFRRWALGSRYNLSHRGWRHSAPVISSHYSCSPEWVKGEKKRPLMPTTSIWTSWNQHRGIVTGSAWLAHQGMLNQCQHLSPEAAWLEMPHDRFASLAECRIQYQILISFAPFPPFGAPCFLFSWFLMHGTLPYKEFTRHALGEQLHGLSWMPPPHLFLSWS